MKQKTISITKTICLCVATILMLCVMIYQFWTVAFPSDETEHRKVEIAEEQAKIQNEYYNSSPEDELQEIKEQVQADLKAETCGEEWEACDDISPYDGSSYEDINFRYDFEEEMIPGGFWSE